MYSRALGHEVETVWPGIDEAQITATRTGQSAGLDPARYGPEDHTGLTGTGQDGERRARRPQMFAWVRG
ncbi:hypothetical protein THIOKS12340004 [Thiocapsa sp. KS1]|nr:hypothetical protein THIOKS12340004 [Thiocapsa sp. KS1]